MVSGFFTSPCDHWRMSSAVARPMRSSSKKLTSSTWFLLSLFVSRSQWGSGRGRAAAVPRRRAPSRSDLFDAAGLAAGQVDAQLLRGPEDVLVGLAHLDRHAVAGEHLDV